MGQVLIQSAFLETTLTFFLTQLVSLGHIALIVPETLFEKDLKMPITVNSTPIQHFNFSGGECHVNIGDIGINKETEVTAHLYNSDDVMCLLMTVNAIRQKNCNSKINLKIPYFPYARQDRACNVGEAFSVSVMAGLINALNCANVTIYDPHSTVTTDLLNNCTVVKQAAILADSVVALDIRNKSLVLLSPDAGAEGKNT